MSQVEQLVAHFAFFAQLGNKPAGHVFGHALAGFLERRPGRRVVQQAAAALQGALQGVQHPPRANMVGHLDTDRHPVQVAGPAQVDDFCLGCHRVGHHRRTACAGQQVGGAPVDVQHLAFDPVDHHPVIHLIRFGGVEHDAGKHVAQGALQRQADHDGHHPGSRQQALDRQFQDITGRGDDGRQKHQRANDILQQAAAVADAAHQRQADKLGEHPRRIQPPHNPQRGCPQLGDPIIGKQRRLQRADPGVENDHAE